MFRYHTASGDTCNLGIPERPDNEEQIWDLRRQMGHMVLLSELLLDDEDSEHLSWQYDIPE
jgi:hypothetical protein